MESKKELEAVFWRFAQLRDEMQEAAQAQEKRLEDHIEALTEAIKKFVTHLDDFKALSSKARKQIKESIELSAKLMAEKVNQELSASLDEKLAATLSALNAATERSTQATLEWRRVLMRKQILITGAFCMGSFLMAFGSIWIFGSKEPCKISGDMIATCRMGEILKNIWPKLSEKEKKRLTTLAK
jgi:hypothetical protein